MKKVLGIDLNINLLSFSLKLTLIWSILLLQYPITVSALVMESQRYVIKSEDISLGGQNSGIDSHVSPLTKTQQTQLEKDGFIIFVPNPEQNRLSFNLDKSSLSFGSEGKSKTVDTTFHVQAPYGYIVNIYEEKEMKALSGSVIEPTDCSKKCSDAFAAIWNNDGTYGFGYNVQGDNTPKDFKNDKYYRALTNIQTGKNIVKTSPLQDASRVKITFKLNLSAGNNEVYNAVIQLNALPSF